MKGEKTVKSSVPYIGFFKPYEGAEKWAGERTLKQAQEHPQALPPSGASFENSQETLLSKELSSRMWGS